MGRYRPKYARSAKSAIWKLFLILLFLALLLLPFLAQRSLFGQSSQQLLSAPTQPTEDLPASSLPPVETTAATLPSAPQEPGTVPTEPALTSEPTLPTEAPVPPTTEEPLPTPAGTEPLPASQPEATEHVHAFLPSKTVPPDCTNAGYTLYVCSCGLESREDPVQALEHQYEVLVIPPSYTAEGYTQYTCERCGDSYRQDVLPPIPTEHSHSFHPVQAAEPNCIMVGYTLYRCSCGLAQKQDFLPALGHQFESTEIPPENGEPGYTVFECTRCHIHYRTY